jgi:hypothetical protein
MGCCCCQSDASPPWRMYGYMHILCILRMHTPPLLPRDALWLSHAGAPPGPVAAGACLAWQPAAPPSAEARQTRRDTSRGSRRRMASTTRGTVLAGCAAAAAAALLLAVPHPYGVAFTFRVLLSGLAGSGPPPAAMLLLVVSLAADPISCVMGPSEHLTQHQTGRCLVLAGIDSRGEVALQALRQPESEAPRGVWTGAISCRPTAHEPWQRRQRRHVSGGHVSPAA